MATRTGQAAIDYANGRVGGHMPASGYCLQFTRECFNVAAKYASAIDAWNASPTKHKNDRHPPRAVPVFFSTPSIYRHVAFYCGDGRIVSTYNADIRAYSSISAVESAFNGPYMGWTEDLNGVDIMEEGDVADLDDVMQELQWIHKRLGGSTSWDPITDMLQAVQSTGSSTTKTLSSQDSDLSWLKKRVGGTTDEGSLSVSKLLHNLVDQVQDVQDSVDELGGAQIADLR